MNQIRCPALRSDDALGFLVALGVVEVFTSSLGTRARLGWEGLGGSAIIETDAEDIEDLALKLYSFARDLDEQDWVLPVGDASLVTAPLSDKERKRVKEDTGTPVEFDPARLTPDEAIRRYERTLELEREGDSETSRWLVALVNQLVSERNGPARALTPLYSPSGKMSLHQNYREALQGVIEDSAPMREALVRWRRREGTGANLDVRALRNSVVTAEGKTGHRAVPGATWLGLMSAPMFLQTGIGAKRGVLGWDAGAKGGAVLRWPVWTPMLDRDAIEVLLGHPCVRRATEPWGRSESARDRFRRRARQECAALGIEGVCTSRRLPLSKSAGALMPPKLLSLR